VTAIVAKIQDFIRLESSAGILLMLAGVLALAANNSFLAGAYDGLLATPVVIQIGALLIDKPLVLWINDGLMAIFFFLVGLEIKREVLQGELSTLDKSALPVFAAIGGVAAPALVYVFFNSGDAEAIRGWAIPAATDIAFALGVLALLGKRAPVSLKVLLLAIAIIDDLAAILIIAFFYTPELSLSALSFAGAGVISLVLLNLAGVTRITPYALVGAFIWVCVLKSGVHATLAGVITALAIPLRTRDSASQSPLHRVEHDLHPWVAFLVLPLFAFANAGVSFQGLTFSDLAQPISLGIALGLIVGKPVGVLAASFIAIRLGVARLPAGATWLHMTGLACLTGIGFTMSLFIGSLAFPDPEAINTVRLGVIAGSCAAALIGVALLFLAHREARHSPVRELAGPSTA
jgi:NhaA family Na+:H+ antiporter